MKLEGNNDTKHLTSICMPVVIQMVVSRVWARLPRRDRRVEMRNPSFMARAFTNRLLLGILVRLSPATYRGGRSVPSGSANGADGRIGTDRMDGLTAEQPPTLQRDANGLDMHSNAATIRAVNE